MPIKIAHGGGYKSKKSYLQRAIVGFNVFVVTAVCSAVFFSSIGINSTVNQEAYADSSNPHGSAVSIRVTKNGSDVSSLDLNLSPTATGAFVKDNLSILVSTTNETGYKLDFSSVDDNTAMTHTNTNITATIPSLTTTTNESSFPVNSWGYSLDPITVSGTNNTNQSFSPIPTKSNPTILKTTTTPTTSLPNSIDQTDITFAIKADTNIPAGTYKDTVVFTAIANYVPNPLEKLTNMQDITPAVCNQAKVGDTATLRDSRDNKTYNIRKMEDGKCWMVQNLALGSANTNTVLTPADSDVAVNFTIPASAVQTSGADAWDATSVHVYDTGQIWIEPTSAGNDSIVHDTGTPPNQSQYVGSYYNWYTATAGTGTESMFSNNATNSICPKGWRLPTGGADSEITTLTDALVNITTNTTSVPDASFTMQASPNYFVLSGRYHTEHYRGGYGLWWSSTASPNGNRSHDLYLTASSVNPQNDSNKNNGFAVRCVVDDASEDICAVNNICYRDNGAKSVTTMSNQAVSANAEVGLWPSNFKRASYGFAGWSTDKNAGVKISDNDASNDPVVYGPMETITVPATVGSVSGLNLYAVWVPSRGILQNWNGCSSLGSGKVTALIDNRDNNTYAVAKLADGNCWMIENLRLGGGSPMNLTSATSNVVANFTLPASQDPTAWCYEFNTTCIDKPILNSNNTTNPVSNMTASSLDESSSFGIYSLGNYYNWYSATAGTGVFNADAGANADSSVCPVGWRLPTGYQNDGSYWNLIVNGINNGILPSTNGIYSGNPEGVNVSELLRSYPNNLVYSGFVSPATSSSFVDRGITARVWTSTAANVNGGREVFFNSDTVYPGLNFGRKYGGHSVRCLAQ